MKNLLSKTGRVSMEDQYTHLRFQFEVPENAQALLLKLSYDPAYRIVDRNAMVQTYLEENETREDVAEWIRRVYKGEARCNNGLVLSLDSPEGHVGSAHRYHEGDVLRVSAEDSTPGYHNTAIMPGVWTAVISIYSMICPTQFTLSVDMEER